MKNLPRRRVVAKTQKAAVIETMTKRAGAHGHATPRPAWRSGPIFNASSLLSKDQEEAIWFLWLKVKYHGWM